MKTKNVLANHVYVKTIVNSELMNTNALSQKKKEVKKEKKVPKLKSQKLKKLFQKEKVLQKDNLDQRKEL